MNKFYKSFSAGMMTLALISPIVASAQTSQEDLRTAVQASVMSDPRVSQIPPDQLKSLIDALVSQAQAQHMSAADILWQPYHADAATAGSSGPIATVCQPGWEGYLCQVNKVFGFEGGNYEIPLILLVVSGLLIAVIWEIRQHHKKVLAAKAAGTAPPISKK